MLRARKSFERNESQHGNQNCANDNRQQWVVPIRVRISHDGLLCSCRYKTGLGCEGSGSRRFV